MTTAAPISIEQSLKGYRYSVEPFLLADFVQTDAGSRVLDVGTGCGIIPLLLTHRAPGLEITAIEIQQSLFDLAVQNVTNHPQGESIHLVRGDFLEMAPTWPAESFDWILSNPPFRKIKSGRINPSREKALARHELTLTLHGLVDASRRLLKPDGKIALVYPAHRLPEVRRELASHNLKPCRIRHVFGQSRTEALFFLMTAAPATSRQEPTEDYLNMVHPDGSTTTELQDIYASYNYSGRPDGLREKRDRG